MSPGLLQCTAFRHQGHAFWRRQLIQTAAACLLRGVRQCNHLTSSRSSSLASQVQDNVITSHLTSHQFSVVFISFTRARQCNHLTSSQSSSLASSDEASETWTLLTADVRSLEKCQRQILGIRWFDHITNHLLLPNRASTSCVLPGTAALLCLVTSLDYQTTSQLIRRF